MASSSSLPASAAAADVKAAAPAADVKIQTSRYPFVPEKVALNDLDDQARLIHEGFDDVVAKLPIGKNKKKIGLNTTRFSIVKSKDIVTGEPRAFAIYNSADLKKSHGKIDRGNFSGVRVGYERAIDTWWIVKFNYIIGNEIQLLKELKQMPVESLVRDKSNKYDPDQKQQHIIFMQYHQGKSVEYYGKHSAFSTTIWLNIVNKLIASLEYLKLLEILHLDIKPPHFFYNLVSDEMKLIDFGFSVKMPNDEKKSSDAIVCPFMVGTYPYIAPEIIDSYRMYDLSLLPEPKNFQPQVGKVYLQEKNEKVEYMFVTQRGLITDELSKSLYIPQPLNIDTVRKFKAEISDILAARKHIVRNLQATYSYATDIYALAVTIIQLLEFITPVVNKEYSWLTPNVMLRDLCWKDQSNRVFNDKTPFFVNGFKLAKLNKISSNKIPEAKVRADMYGFVKKMLDVDPVKRPDIRQVSQFFAKLYQQHATIANQLRKVGLIDLAEFFGREERLADLKMFDEVWVIDAEKKFTAKQLVEFERKLSQLKVATGKMVFHAQGHSASAIASHCPARINADYPNMYRCYFYLTRQLIASHQQLADKGVCVLTGKNDILVAAHCAVSSRCFEEYKVYQHQLRPAENVFSPTALLELFDASDMALASLYQSLTLTNDYLRVVRTLVSCPIERASQNDSIRSCCDRLRLQLLTRQLSPQSMIDELSKLPELNGFNPSDFGVPIKNTCAVS